MIDTLQKYRDSNAPLKWYVIYGDFNSRKIEAYNVFDHYSFWQDCCQNRRKNKDREAFDERLRRDLQYYFWSKCEWEIIVSHWPTNERFHDEKIDVYDQVMLNWNQFADYVWENRKELKPYE